MNDSRRPEWARPAPVTVRMLSATVALLVSLPLPQARAGGDAGHTVVSPGGSGSAVTGGGGGGSSSGSGAGKPGGAGSAGPDGAGEGVAGSGWMAVGGSSGRGSSSPAGGGAAGGSGGAGSLAGAGGDGFGPTAPGTGNGGSGGGAGGAGRDSNGAGLGSGGAGAPGSTGGIGEGYGGGQGAGYADGGGGGGGHGGGGGGGGGSGGGGGGGGNVLAGGGGGGGSGFSGKAGGAGGASGGGGGGGGTGFIATDTLFNFGAIGGGGGGGGGIGGGGGGGGGLLATGLPVGSSIVNYGSIGGGGGGGGAPGSGGGGGTGAVIDTILTNRAGATISGGGGGGGTVGGGGGGGAALVISNTRAITVTNDGTMQGGSGGGGRDSTAGAGGGGGGAGLYVTGTASAAVTIVNGGTIIGGAGAAGEPARLSRTFLRGGGGEGGAAGGSASRIDGAGGAGIVGHNLAITNTGRIAGGLGGDGTTRADAITFTGGVNRLTLGAASTMDGNITIGGRGTLMLDQRDDVALGNVIAGDGTLIKSGAGTVVLSGTNSYSGGTTVEAGTLLVTRDDNLGAASGALTFNGGTLQVTSAFSSARQVALAGNGTIHTDTELTLSGDIAGGGLIAKTGTGTLILSGNNSYTGGTQIREGTLEARGGRAIGDSSAVFVLGGAFRVAADETVAMLASGPTAFGRVELAGATLTVAYASARTTSFFYGSIAGTGGFTKDGAFTQVLAGDNSYSGPTRILAGTLYAFGAGRNVIPDASAVTIATGATLSLAAPPRELASGTHDETIGSLAGSGTVQLGGRVLTTGGDNTSTIFAGTIAGAGGFAKIGTGLQVLSGISSYSGATTVTGGILSVDGSIASSSLVTVARGGVLAGTGTVGHTLVNAGGALSPGNSIGTLTVKGDLTFAAGSTYAVEVSPHGSDRVIVSGTAMLGATLAASYAPGAYVSKRYTVLSAGSVSGTFSGPVNTNLPASFTTALAYDATGAYLDLTLNYVPPGPTAPNYGAGLTVNQANVANALVTSFNAAGGIPLVFGGLTASGLSGASGEAATGILTATVGVMSRFLNLMTDPYSNGRNASVTEMADLARGPRGVIVAEPARWSAWASGYGGVQATGGNAAVGSHGTSTSIYGTAVGADYRVSPDTMIGFALGAAGTSYRLGQGLGGGSSDVFQIGLYGRHQIGAAYIAAALAYGWQDVTTERRFMGDRLTGRFTTQAFSGRVETGYRFATGFAGLTPYAAGEVVSLSTAGYREQVTSGSGLFALDYAGRSATVWRTELGLRADKAIRIGEAEFTLRGRLAWAHNVNPNAIVSASFVSLPASGFVVQGAREAPNALLTSAGAELKWANGWSAAATFEGSFSGRGSSYAGRGTLRYQW